VNVVEMNSGLMQSEHRTKCCVGQKAVEENKVESRHRGY